MRTLLTVGLAAAIPFVASSQVLLNAGDSFTYEFTNFDFQAHGLTGPSARVGLGLQGFSGTDSLRFEAFENTPAQPAIYSTTLTPAGYPDFTFGAAWQDLEGSFRVTMLSGSATLTDFFGSVVTTGGDLYSLKVTVVPEPSAWSLLGTIGLPLLAWARTREQGLRNLSCSKSLCSAPQ